MAENHWLREFQRSVKNKRHHSMSPCKCMQMHVYNKAIYICPKPQSECICFDQSLKWDLSVGHKNNVCLKENSSGFRSLQWGCSVHCGIAVCNAAKVVGAFPYNPLHPEAYSLPVKRLSYLHLACKTLIYLLAFSFLTKLFLKSPKPMYSFINCILLLTLQEASWIISRCFKTRPKKSWFIRRTFV